MKYFMAWAVILLIVNCVLAGVFSGTGRVKYGGVFAGLVLLEILAGVGTLVWLIFVWAVGVVL